MVATLPPSVRAGDAGEELPPPAGEVLAATGASLRARRDELAPLVAAFERIGHILQSFGDQPSAEASPDEDGHDPSSARRLHGQLVRELGDSRARLEEWASRLEPLVREHDQIEHVLVALDSAGAVTQDVTARRRRSTGRMTQRRTGAASAGGQARLDELRGLLGEPRPRAQLAELLQLSPSRVTELLEPLARAGEIVEIRDPERPSRKLWKRAASEDGRRDG